MAATETVTCSATTEADIIAGGTGGETIVITLTGNEWADDVDTIDNRRNLLIDSLTTNSEPAQWAKVTAALKAAGAAAVTRDSNTQVTINLPDVAGYDITANQIITVNPALGVLRYQANTINPVQTFALTADTAAMLSGTATAGINEKGIVDGYKTLIITLTNETWKTDFEKDSDLLDDLFEALQAGSEVAEWDEVINTLKANPASVITRNSDTMITITLPPVAGYDITAMQTITVNLPTTILTSGVALQGAAPSLTISPIQTVATLGGSVLTPPTTETQIIGGGKDIIITLTDNTWSGEVETILTDGNLLFDMLEASSESAEWAKVIDGIKTAGSISRDSATQLTITLQAIAGYNILADQTINVQIPSSLLENTNLPLLNSLSFKITANEAAALTGTVIDPTTPATEADILAGGKTIILTLTNNTWQPDVVSSSTKRLQLINDLTAAGAEAAQWDNVLTAIKDAADPASVIKRTSNTMVTITLPAVTNYNISADQTITASIDPSLLTTAPAGPLVVAPSFTIKPIAPTATVTGTVISATPVESDIVGGGKTIILTLTNDTWASDIASDQTKREDLLDGFVAGGLEAAQWNNVITAAKTAALANPASVIVRTSDKIVTIILPATAAYHITADQTVSVLIPATDLIVASADVTPSPASFKISQLAATISGTIISTFTSKESIVSGGKTIIVTLGSGTWATDIVTTQAKRDALLNGFVAGGAEAGQWTNVITAAKTAAVTNAAAVIARTSDKVVTITLPAVAGYAITGDQTITLTIPANALTNGGGTLAATPTITIATTSVITAAVTGTVTTLATTEGDILNGGRTIIVTLTNATWATDVATEKTKRDALITGLATSAEAVQWAKVQTALKADATRVVRNSDTQVTITLPPTAGYNVVASQSVTLTIPKAILLQSGMVPTADVAAAPSFTVTAVSPLAAITAGSINASDINIGGKTIAITLTNDIWATDVASNTTKREALINGLVTAATDKTQWAKVITELKANPTAVVRNSNTLVTITLPAVSSYANTASETITLTVPTSVLSLASANLVAAPSITIGMNGSATLAGTIITAPPTAADIVAGGKTIVINLTNDTWAADITTDATKYAALYGGLVASTETTQWSKVIALLGGTNITRNSNTMVTITLPPVANYAIKTNQSIKLTIPAGKSILNLTNAAVEVTPTMLVKVAMSDLLTGTNLDNLFNSGVYADKIQVNVPPKYINSVTVYHNPLGTTPVVTSIEVLAEVGTAKVVAIANGVTREDTDFVLSSGKRLFVLNFTGLTAPGDIELQVYDANGASLQRAVTIRFATGTTKAITPSTTTIKSSYILNDLVKTPATFNSITAAYQLSDLSVSIIQ